MKWFYFYIFSLFCIFTIGCSSTSQVYVTTKPAVSAVSLERIREDTKVETNEMVEFLSKTIQYKSVEDFGYKLKPETKDLMEFVFKTAEGMGFSTRLAADGLVGVLEYGQGKETVGVLIHLDVVPVSEEEVPEWMHPPFSGINVDGYVWGRGAQDDKGALAATLWAAKILIDNKMHFKRQLRVVLGTKEEKSFESLTKYFEEEAQPDYGFVPDGIFIMQGEKGIADIDYAFSGLTPVTNSAQRDTIVYWDGGTVINTVPDFSYVVIKSSDVEASRTELLNLIKSVTDELQLGKSERFYGVQKPYSANLGLTDYQTFVSKHSLKGIPKGDLVLYSKGIAAHGSEPWAGENAIVEVALVGSLMSRLSDNAFKRAFQFVVSKIGLSLDGSGLTNEKGEGIPYTPLSKLPAPPPGFLPVRYYGTSTNLGLVRVKPDKDTLVLSINFRTGLGNNNAQIINHSKCSVEQFEGKASYQPGLGSHYEGFYHPADDPLLSMVVTCYKDVYPESPAYVPYIFVSPGTTYMKLVSNFTNFGPVDLYPDPKVDLFHQKNERISIESLLNNSILYAYTLQKLIQAEKAPIRK